MKLQLSLFLLLKYSTKGNKLPFGSRLVYNQRRYTHIGLGFFVLVLFSLRFQTVYNISFLNKEQDKVNITVISKSQVKRYSVLPGFELKEKRIWKK